VERAFEVGLAVGDRVFAAVIQPVGPETGTIAVAADNAFDAGAVVLAANGNCAVDPDCRARVGSPAFSTVRTPANAHKALGVGDFNVVDLATRPYQGRGPTLDGRIKPDIQAPTDVKTASSASPTALKERFGGTSASTPFAAGAAALMRNWLRKFNTFDPGATYARLILSGDAFWSPFGYSNLFGAGHLRLPALCGVTANWGKVTFSSSSRERTPVVSVPIQVVGSGRSLAVALWWPESVREAHDDIDVRVLDPNGVERASARSALSVFERTEVAGPLMSGTWTVEIRGTDVESPPQTVYWTADVRRHCFGTAPGP
jgi:serine protease AprX